MKRVLLFLFLSFVSVRVTAQTATSSSSTATNYEETSGPQEQIYRRSSLYSILVSHSATKYHSEIEDVFHSIPIPEKFDNHDLNIKVLTTSQKRINEATISDFMNRNNVARHLVARWFNRNSLTGECNMDLISQRGLYDATYFDVELARMSQRGFGMLADAGEELIGNTFVIVNDIRYTDKQKTSKVFGTIFKAIGAAAAIASKKSEYADLGNSVGDLVEQIKGFGVTVTSYLYRLDWNDETANRFYSEYYIGNGETDAQKFKAFEASQAFTVKYIGSQRVSSGKISMRGVSTYDPIQMIRKVCTRAIDESIVALQKNHDEFKIKTPIYSVSPTITAKVGLKEGISERNKYEVLEQYIDKSGKTAYRRVGVIQPIKGKIWDNRYMAVEENAVGSKLDGTTFRKVSGGDFYPGMLIREIKVK